MCGTPKILEKKKGATAQKSKENRKRKKARKSKKARIGGSGKVSFSPQKFLRMDGCDTILASDCLETGIRGGVSEGKAGTI